MAKRPPELGDIFKNRLLKQPLPGAAAGSKTPVGCRRHKCAVLFMGLLLSLLLFLTPVLGEAAAPEKGALLAEICRYLEKYYLYTPKDGIELKSLEQLELLWQDPYSAYLSEGQFSLFTESLERSLTGIGVYLEKGQSKAVTVVSVIPESPAGRAGIQGGDIIVSAGGQSVLDFPLENVVLLLRGEEGTTVSLTVQRAEQLLTFQLVRERIKLPAVEYTLLPGEVALLRLYMFAGGTAGEISRLLATLEQDGVRGIILDLRDNQGGYVEEALALAAFFTEGPLLQVREKETGWQVITRKDSKLSCLPTVVLLNRGTASGAEIVAAALKDNGAALLVGENSFGKGTMQTVVSLKQGGYLKMTTAEFASPRQRQIEGIGVEPHIFINDPREQESIATLLLQHMLEQKSHYIAMLLGRHMESGLPLPLWLGEEPYYPLRALLNLTGRSIFYEGEQGVYSFTWDGRPYRLELKEKLLTWQAPSSLLTSHVLLYKGSAYVPLSFLEDGLGFPFLQELR